MHFMHRGWRATVFGPHPDGSWHAIVSDRFGNRVQGAVHARSKEEVIAKAKQFIDREFERYATAMENPAASPMIQFHRWFTSDSVSSYVTLAFVAVGVGTIVKWLWNSGTPKPGPVPGPVPAPVPSGGYGGQGFQPGSCDFSHVPAGCPSEAVPAGYKIWDGKSNHDQLIAFIRSYSLGNPLDSWVDVQIGNYEYKAHNVCHFHDCQGPVTPHGWHVGVSVYERIANA